MNTTHTKEPTEQKEKPKGGQLLETIDLRDYFAAKAMQGQLSRSSANYLSDDDHSKYAYAMADAMLRAREAS
jgi:high-affinity Fe2+/Pb2+ permease